jgi:hypothetical protein
MSTTSLSTETIEQPANTSTSRVDAKKLWKHPWLIGWILVVEGVLYYLFGGMHFGLLEAPLFILGTLVFLLPLGGLIFHLFRAEVADPLDRFVLAALASYSLTTLFYFGLAELHLIVLFYFLQITLIAWFLRRCVQDKSWRVIGRCWEAVRSDRLNPTLALIVVASLISCIKYNTYLHEQPDGSALLATYHDATDHSAHAYELMRHIPPLQSTMRAGQPERAYHCLPQLAIGLIGKYTLQGDLLRANLFYRHTLLEVLTCLSLFCLGRWLSGRPGGGYVAAALMFVIVYPFPAFIPNTLGYYFFTLEPHVSSFLEPIVLTYTQGFDSVPMLYGMALGMLIVGRHVRAGTPAFWLTLIMALMAAAEMRFNVHMYLPLAPGFLFLLAFFCFRSRRWSFLVAIGAFFLVSALLQLEMRSPAYLKSSSQILLTYNGVARGAVWMKFWPFHQELENWLLARLGDNQKFNWTWQIVCMTAFVSLNICGIPMMVAAIIYLRRAKAWTEHLPSTIILLSLSLGSLLGGILLNTTYDSYSLGAEMLNYVCFYGFPIYCLIAWQIVNWVWTKSRLTPLPGSYAVMGVLVVGVLAQYGYPMTGLQEISYSLGGVQLSPATRGALAYLHDQTPPDSVVASNEIFNPRTAIYGGIGGRACYAEYFNYAALDLLPGVITTRERIARINRIWQTKSESEMSAELQRTPINYLVEYSDHPLALHPAACLLQVWRGEDPDGREVSVWEVLHPGPNALAQFP